MARYSFAEVFSHLVANSQRCFQVHTSLTDKIVKGFLLQFKDTVSRNFSNCFFREIGPKIHAQAKHFRVNVQGLNLRKFSAILKLKDFLVSMPISQFFYIKIKFFKMGKLREKQTIAFKVN